MSVWGENLPRDFVASTKETPQQVKWEEIQAGLAQAGTITE